MTCDVACRVTCKEKRGTAKRNHGIDKEACYKALRTVEAIAHDPEVGTVFVGTVTRILDFGAFVEYAPGNEGLCHISKLDKKRVGKVTVVCNVGE